MTRLGLAMLLAVSLTWALPALAAEQGCNSPLPVLDQPASGGPSWRLPINADHLDTLTYATLKLTLLPPSGERKTWAAQINVSFPDPKPLGIPYSFEKLELQWVSARGAATAILDWTQACTQVGRSLFPGQEWSQNWEIPGTEGLQELDHVTASLWGGRY
jgi:hypothetical protein